jgi:hypothetical protein
MEAPTKYHNKRQNIQELHLLSCLVPSLVVGTLSAIMTGMKKKRSLDT